MQIGATTVENSMAFPQKLKSRIAIPFLGIYPKNPKTLIQKNICTPIFIAALFIIAKIWEQTKCPSVDDWIKKLWYIYTMEYYSVVGGKRRKRGRGRRRRKSYLL